MRQEKAQERHTDTRNEESSRHQQKTGENIYTEFINK